jgi:hypothetical protein
MECDDHVVVGVCDNPDDGKRTGTTFRMGLKLIQAKRLKHFGEDVALETSPKHIREAEVKYGLGVSEPSRIDLVKLGWKEDILIS